MRCLLALLLSTSLYATTITSGVETVISSDSGNFLPQIAFNTAGEGVAVWTQTRTSTNTGAGIEASTDIIASLYDPTTGSWDSVPTTIGNGSSPQVGIDADGNCFAIFILNSQIQAVKYTSTADTWDSVATALTTANTNAFPALTVSSNGIAAVTWIAYQEGSTVPFIQVSAYDGTNWSLATTISTPNVGDLVTAPRIAIDNTAIPPGPVKGQILWQSASQTTQTAGQITAVSIEISDD